MRVLIAIAAATLCTLAAVRAQEFPARPIRMIVPLTAGSGADIAGRIIGKSMSETWHQPVVVENRPGAGGQIGTQAVVKADADGYTLLVQSASHAANSAIYKSLPYDPLKDLVDVARLGVTPYVMVESLGWFYGLPIFGKTLLPLLYRRWTAWLGGNPPSSPA
jgi:tripartite-type tricarboxylate transporter receptor subunit TctC